MGLSYFNASNTIDLLLYGLTLVYVFTMSDCLGEARLLKV